MSNCVRASLLNRLPLGSLFCGDLFCGRPFSFGSPHYSCLLFSNPFKLGANLIDRLPLQDRTHLY